jgi:putative hydrolase
MPGDIPFGFGLPGGDAPDPSDPRQMQQFINQLQSLFATPGGGPVNWELARQLAHAHLTGVMPGGGTAVNFSNLQMGFTLPGMEAQPAIDPADETPRPVGDPSVTTADRAAVLEALRLADLWLDPESSLPSGIRASAAWSRGEWLNATLDVWRKLCDPVAERMVSAMTELVPEEMRAQMGPMTSMVASLGGALLGGQLGTALGSLAAEVLSAGDIGLPLGPAGTAALVPANIAEYGKGLEIPDDQVRLYVALREAAHQRLFGHVPWLRGHVFAAIQAYAAGIHVDRDAVEQAMSRLDPMSLEGNPQELILEGIFTPEDTPQQRAALVRLETVLALVEGWVGHVVDRAAGDRLPDVIKLSEAFRRRRAAGGPAEQTFSALVGLELRPRRLREATALWDALTEHRGVAGRDALWGHPDLLPDEEAFSAPQEFAQASAELSDLDDVLKEMTKTDDDEKPEEKPED